jgi:hypothetical protein
MPHNIYLQSWLVKDAAGPDKRAAIRASSACTIGAMSLAFFINAAILVVAASVFHQAGRADVTDIRDAHALLSPLVGTAAASTLFALALLAAGLNATFTATLAGQVVMEGFLKIRIPAWQRRLFHAAARADPGAVRGRPRRRRQYRLASGPVAGRAEHPAAVRPAAAAAFRRIEARDGRLRCSAPARDARLAALQRAIVLVLKLLVDTLAAL